jgi:hypothetical protein
MEAPHHRPCCEKDLVEEMQYYKLPEYFVEQLPLYIFATS